MDVEVRSFGDQKVDSPHLTVRGFGLDASTFRSPKNLNSVFGAIRRCTDFNTAGVDADVVHCHTWYTHFGAILAKINYNIPMVLTVHSLEPLRPWKREQLGHGYDFSRWLEKTAMEMADAVIAVSEETKQDVLRLFEVDPKRIRIIHNGIDPEEYYPRTTTGELTALGIDPNKPFVLFVGRIARQKGIIHLVNAIKYLDPGFQVVLCAGAPDTPEIAGEMKRAVTEAQSKHEGVIWVEKMVAKKSVYELYTHAAVFCCPSIYEPFGIINLEAMACETAVVASAVGGIKEVVVEGETGFLVPLEQMKESPYEPVDPDRFSRDLAEKINLLMRDEALRTKFGKAGRERAVAKFSWETIATETKKMYESLGLRVTAQS
jgi:alpha-maltose-1-phosphate synthase